MTQAWTPATIKDWVELVQAEYMRLEGANWQTMTPTGIWIEASQIAPKEWREIIRVLAQGGEYYSIAWAA